MGILGYLSCAGGLIAFFVMLVVSRSITDEVNNALGTKYERFWSRSGNEIWSQHERLFPASPKRRLLAVFLSLAFGLLLAAGFLPR